MDRVTRRHALRRSASTRARRCQGPTPRPAGFVSNWGDEPQPRPWLDQPSSGSGKWSAAGLIGQVASAVEGERNDRLHWAGCRIAEDVVAGKASRTDADDAATELERVAIKVGLSKRKAKWTVRAAVLERDGHTFQIKRAKCRTLATEVDDIRPVSDRGVPLRDVQLAARHADPRTTTTNDRRRENFGRHATYVVVAFIAGT